MDYHNVSFRVEIIVATPNGERPPLNDTDVRKALFIAVKDGLWVHAGPGEIVVTHREG